MLFLAATCAQESFLEMSPTFTGATGDRERCRKFNCRYESIGQPDRRFLH